MSGFDPTREAERLTPAQAAALRAYCMRVNSPWGYYASDLGVSGAACSALWRKGLLHGGLFAGDRTHAYRWTKRGEQVFQALCDRDRSANADRREAAGPEGQEPGREADRPDSTMSEPLR